MKSKKTIAALISAVLALAVTSCNTTETETEFLAKNALSPKDGEILTETVYNGDYYENPVLGVKDTFVSDTGETIYSIIGDPFVMRYNGMYYLYPSSYGETGVQCWTSENLVNWHYEGICTDENVEPNDWAPEVKYYNGKFYMYTSPHGNGHYIYESDSPTGPFKEVSGNWGLNWDGDVFIDDDGKWTFYTAENGGSLGGIQICDMTSPTEIDTSNVRKSGIEVNCGTSDWTEGSMLIKYNGVYYMTYCGNRVESKSYRINYSSSTGTLNDFVEGTNNPLLVNTDPITDTGLGHSSSVLGPNLDSYYIVYHSLIDVDNKHTDHNREMHIAPLIMNGSYLQALGHVTTNPEPEMPDIYSRFEKSEDLNGWAVEKAEVTDGCLTVLEGGKVLSEKGFADDYTVEWNFKYIDGKAGAVFGYSDKDNCGTAFINTENKTLEITFKTNGESTFYEIPVKGSFDDDLNFNVLQTLTLRKSGTKYTFLLNDLTVGEYESTLGRGRIGIAAETGTAKFGFIGAEGNVWLSSMKEYFKPIAGSLQAITCVENNIVLSEHDSVNYVTVNGGECYNYFVDITENSMFALGIHYTSETDVSFEMYKDGELVFNGILPPTENENSTVVFNNIKLTSGSGVITFKFTEGSADIFEYEFAKASGSSEYYEISIDSPKHEEYEWSVEDGVFSTDNAGKFIYGETTWSDYTLSATFSPKPGSTILRGILMFRVSNYAGGGQWDIDYNEGRSCYQGYYLVILRNNSGGRITLYKQNFGSTRLTYATVDLGTDGSANVEVKAVGSNIQVYCNGELAIDYTDPNPFITGAVGLQEMASTLVSNLEVTPINN